MKVACPECEEPVEFAAVFESSFCWAKGAVAFNCPSCGKPAYFAPGNQSIEVGMLGASPTLDPIPGVRYPTQVTTDRQEQFLTISWQGHSKQLPSAYVYISGHRGSHGL
jgi:hypothetical protein